MKEIDESEKCCSSCKEITDDLAWLNGKLYCYVCFFFARATTESEY